MLTNIYNLNVLARYTCGNYIKSKDKMLKNDFQNTKTNLISLEGIPYEYKGNEKLGSSFTQLGRIPNSKLYVIVLCIMYVLCILV